MAALKISSVFWICKIMLDFVFLVIADGIRSQFK